MEFCENIRYYSYKKCHILWFFSPSRRETESYESVSKNIKKIFFEFWKSGLVINFEFHFFVFLNSFRKKENLKKKFQFFVRTECFLQFLDFDKPTDFPVDLPKFEGKKNPTGSYRFLKVDFYFVKKIWKNFYYERKKKENFFC